MNNQTIKQELKIFTISYVLNFFWEMWQLIFFTDSFIYNCPQSLPFLPYQANLVWIISTWVITDALLITIPCLIISKIKGTQEWYYNPGKDLIILTLICVGFSIIGERIGVLNNWWSYSPLMPIIPLINVAIVPTAAFFITPYSTLKIVKYLNHEKISRSGKYQGAATANEIL